MNLDKLFETQKKLDDRIVEEKGLQGVDLLDKKILALQVELGELANEWRGFKFWKVDPKPNTTFPNMIPCDNCKGSGYEVNGEVFGGEECSRCGGRGAYAVGRKNPLLEEYVDCLHFILGIGNDLKCTKIELIDVPKTSDITYQFLNMFEAIHYILEYRGIGNYRDMLSVFVTLGKQLGFTWSEIEQAYYDKNKINHQRQANGY